MKASIIIPAHNEEKYIAPTIRAALSQDFAESYEVIVVDNASTDDTVRVAQSFAGVTVISEDQKGVQFAREKGRKAARGGILAYLDADSLAPTDWLRKGILCLERNPRVVGASGPYDYYDAQHFFRVFSLSAQKIFFPIVHWIVQILHLGGVMVGGNSFFRADALERIGGFNTAIRFYGDDTDTARRLTAVGSIVYDKSLTVRTSARRDRTMGIVQVQWLYFINFLWVILFHRPFSQ